MTDFDLTSMQVADIFGVQRGHQVLKVHSRSRCEGQDTPCCIHSPSEHHMLTWEMNWRADTGVMERICPHGIGHPDPDHLAYIRSVTSRISDGIHGCDGCCIQERNND